MEVECTLEFTRPTFINILNYNLHVVVIGKIYFVITIFYLAFELSEVNMYIFCGIIMRSLLTKTFGELKKVRVRKSSS